MSRPFETRVHDLLTWLEKQRIAHADMVTDAGDASLWCKEEAERIADYIQTVIDLNELRLRSDDADILTRYRAALDEIDRLRAALQEAAE